MPQRMRAGSQLPAAEAQWGRWGKVGVPTPLLPDPQELPSMPPHTQPLLPLQEGTLHSWLSSRICCAPGTMKRMFATS